MTFSSDHQREVARDVPLMRRALELAAHGPVADPNPRVGAVIADRSGTVVGEGFHEGAGTPHAEVVALDRAGRGARGGTAVVTLEPCDHRGLTGPCTQALIDAGVVRVVYAQTDPNPRAGGGAHTLARAGIDVRGGVLTQEAEKLNEAWAFAFAHGRPLVSWKFAATLDGRSAATDASSRWITGAEARADVHDRRAQCDAIVIGTGTVLADDPQLTVRHPDGSLRDRQPLRVVVGQRAIPVGARVLDGAAPTLHLTERDPALVLKLLAEQEIHHIWLEGGPRLAAAFVRAGLVDEVVAYLAPALLGAGAMAVGDLGITSMDQIRRLVPREVSTLGMDIRIIATMGDDIDHDHDHDHERDRDHPHTGHTNSGHTNSGHTSSGHTNSKEHP